MKLQHRLATEIVLASLCLAGPASTDLVYNVSVNTAAIKTTAGFLDFQFAPGLGSQAASVQVKSFAAPGGVLAGSPILSGEASGLLPATGPSETAFSPVRLSTIILKGSCSETLSRLRWISADRP